MPRRAVVLVLAALAAVAVVVAPVSALPSSAHKLRAALTAASDASARVGPHQVDVTVHLSGKTCKCKLAVNDGATTPVAQALVPLRTCNELLTIGLKADAQSTILSGLDATWLAATISQGADRADFGDGVNVPITPNPYNGKALSLRLHSIDTVSGQLVQSADGAAFKQPVVCVAALASAGIAYTTATVAACGNALHAHVAERQGVLPNAVPAYTFTKPDVQTVGQLAQKPADQTKLAAGTLLLYREPVKVTVRRDDPAQKPQTVTDLWVLWSSRRKWDATLIGALNARAQTMQVQGWVDLVSGDRSTGQATTLTYHAAPVKWNDDVPGVAQPLVVEVLRTVAVPNANPTLSHAYFAPSFTHQALVGNNAFTNQPASESVLLDTQDAAHHNAKTPEVVYLNFASGNFIAADDVPQTRVTARAAAVAALVAAAGKTYRDEVDAQALYDTLSTDGGASAGASRVLKRALEAAHGRSRKHFGFAYFLLKVVVGKTNAPHPDHSAVKYVGFLTAADNLAGTIANMGNNGAGLHSEQRMVEQLRRFINKLEVTGAANDVQMRVVQVKSRWITDYFPDVSGDNNCQWALQFYDFCAKSGWFRHCQYTETVRKAGPISEHDAWAATQRSDGFARLSGQQQQTRKKQLWNDLTLAAFAKGFPAPHTAKRALDWVKPVGHRVYSDAEDATCPKLQAKARQIDPDVYADAVQLQNECREAAHERARKQGLVAPNKALEDLYAARSVAGTAWYAITLYKP